MGALGGVDYQKLPYFAWEEQSAVGGKVLFIFEIFAKKMVKHFDKFVKIK